MKHHEYTQLQAEKKSLERMLANIPAENVIDRGGLQAKIQGIEQALRAAGSSSIAPAKAKLTFRGRPVIDSHGIFAEFGMLATKAFTDAVTAVASSFSGPLSAMGPIRNRDQNQLLITSTAVGSFGFEVEEYHGEALPMALEGQSAVGMALQHVQSVLQGTIGSDDELTDTAAGTDPRALTQIRSFLEIVASNDAVCALEYKEHTFRFNDVSQVQNSLERLSIDNIHQNEEVLFGEFCGVLPSRRTFEFKIAGQPDVFVGKVGPNITNADILNDHLHVPLSIRVASTRIGSGRPKYQLIEIVQNDGG